MVEGIEMGWLFCVYMVRYNFGWGMGRRSKVFYFRWIEEIRICGVIFVIEVICEVCFGEESVVFSR